ncbi:TetR/AcrR family transcriptional regulator [Siphonobacter sp.]|uniref:TetR/AcrR family transcriptional regulator n=1 Tax=Siphonobacter sp. TaxID=1869184 RepID=UPI003B3BB3FE
MARNVEFNEEEAIQKATDVFWEKGYHGASLRDLTDAMQINSSSLYNTIGDKHQLFVKCLKYYIQNKREFLQNQSARADSPLAAIVNFIEAASETIIKDANGCLAVKTAFEVSPKDDSIQSILKADNDFTRNYLSSLVKQAINEGEMVATEDPDLLADFIVASYTGWYELHVLYANPKQIRNLAQLLIRQISS